MQLADPLLVVRDLLLADAGVVALVGGGVYASPVLPPDREYPLIRLQHIGTTTHSPVAFRQAATAVVQMDVWARGFSECATIAEVALDCVSGIPPAGAGAIRVSPTFEARSVDETAQPALYRYRADLAVRVVGAAPVGD